MATNLVTTCDFIRSKTSESHGVPATTRFRGTFEDGKEYEADLCADCVAELQREMARLGIRPSIAMVGGKPRGAYVTAKGRSYTTAEAREWLISNGYDVSPTGRVSRKFLKVYAAEH